MHNYPHASLAISGMPSGSTAAHTVGYCLSIRFPITLEQEAAHRCPPHNVALLRRKLPHRAAGSIIQSSTSATHPRSPCAETAGRPRGPAVERLRRAGYPLLQYHRGSAKTRRRRQRPSRLRRQPMPRRNGLGWRWERRRVPGARDDGARRLGRQVPRGRMGRVVEIVYPVTHHFVWEVPTRSIKGAVIFATLPSPPGQPR